LIISIRGCDIQSSKLSGEMRRAFGQKQRNKGSWASVTKGVRVNVTAHSEGSNKVVDKVQIVSGS
jgi:hypothetical protein